MSENQPGEPTQRGRPNLGRRAVDAVRYGNSAVHTLLAFIVAMAVGAVWLGVAAGASRTAARHFCPPPVEPSRARGRMVGSDQYLTKPFTKESLLKAVAAHVRAVAA